MDEKHVKGDYSYHALRIIGWGEERQANGDVVKYWLAANSWGRKGGENGYWRILRGRDELNIEKTLTFPDLIY